MQASVICDEGLLRYLKLRYQKYIVYYENNKRKDREKKRTITNLVAIRQLIFGAPSITCQFKVQQSLNEVLLNERHHHLLIKDCKGIVLSIIIC
jgi:hypothetical protein